MSKVLTENLDCIALSHRKWYSLSIRNAFKIELRPFRIKEGTLKTNIMKLLIAVVALKASLAISAEPLPAQESSSRSWIQAINEDDKKGTLSEMKETVDSWNFIDEIADNHDLPNEVRGDLKARRKYLTSNMLKFFGRKVSEEAKNPEGNQTMVAVARINSGLETSSSLGSDSFKLKFRGKFLQGNGSMLVINPYLDFSVQMDLSKGAFIEGSKKFKELDLNSTLNYSLKEQKATFRVDRDIAQGLNAGVTYQNGPSTPNAGEVTLKLMYSRPF